MYCWVSTQIIKLSFQSWVCLTSEMSLFLYTSNLTRWEQLFMQSLYYLRYKSGSHSCKFFVSNKARTLQAEKKGSRYINLCDKTCWFDLMPYIYWACHLKFGELNLFVFYFCMRQLWANYSTPRAERTHIVKSAGNNFMSKCLKNIAYCPNDPWN